MIPGRQDVGNLPSAGGFIHQQFVLAPAIETTGQHNFLCVSKSFQMKEIRIADRKHGIGISLAILALHRVYRVCIPLIVYYKFVGVGPFPKVDGKDPSLIRFGHVELPGIPIVEIACYCNAFGTQTSLELKKMVRTVNDRIVSSGTIFFAQLVVGILDPFPIDDEFVGMFARFEIQIDSPARIHPFHGIC